MRSMTPASEHAPALADGGSGVADSTAGDRVLGDSDAVDAEPEQARVLLHMPVDVRSVSLAVVAVLASVFALHWAQAVIVPVLLGVMFSYALAPVVDRMESWRLPRAAGAGLLIFAIIGGLGWGAWSMSDDATALVETLPEVAQKLRQSMRGANHRVDPFAKVQQAATEIQSAAEESANATAPASAAASAASGVGPVAVVAAAPSAPRGASTPRPANPSAITVVTTTTRTRPEATHVVVEKEAFNVRDFVWTGTLGLLAFLGQTMVVLLVAFFLLASGNNFRRKMVKLAGPKLSQKRVTIQALDEITGQIQRYLMVQVATSVVVGVLTGLAFWALGLEHAAVWGVVAGVTNLIPYVGAVIVGAGSGVVALLQFGAVDQALFVGASSFAIHAVVGNLLTPWLTGKASRMSPFAVFVGVLAFGWLWGAVGLILGVPILMVVKTVCDRVDELKPVGEFLGA